MINCNNKEIISELKTIFSDENLDEKQIYANLKKGNSLENMIKTLQEFLLKKIQF